MTKAIANRFKNPQITYSKETHHKQWNSGKMSGNIGSIGHGTTARWHLNTV